MAARNATWSSRARARTPACSGGAGSGRAACPSPSPLEAALALTPLAATVAFLSRAVAPRLVARFPHRTVDAAGLVVFAGGFAVLATLDTNSSYLHILAGLLPMAAGIGLATAPATASIVASLPASKQGVASAVNNTVREVGGAVGIAVLGSILNDGYRDGIAEHTAQMPPEAAERARDSLSFVVHAAGRFGEPGQQLLDAARRSFVDGYTTAMAVCSAIVAVGALVVFGRGGRAEPGDGAGGAGGDGVAPHTATGESNGSEQLLAPAGRSRRCRVR